MGRACSASNIGETDYKVCLLPLGGFVKDDGRKPESGLTGSRHGQSGRRVANDPGAFTSHPRWQRMLIGLPDRCVNFLLTLALMCFTSASSTKFRRSSVKTTTVEWVTPGSAAARQGLRSGDVITRFDNVKNPDWDSVYDHIRLNANQLVPVTVERGGKTLQLSCTFRPAPRATDFDLSDAGISPQYLPGPIAVAEVQAGTARRRRRACSTGDAIEAVDGHAFHYSEYAAGLYASGSRASR